uniref:Uncharacterized protein n=1 Tax=Opuntia streptacantha TaxID=393608 RepID=A0A7C9DME5_OPUST
MPKSILNDATNNRVLSFELLLPISENTKLLLSEAIEGRDDIVVVLAHLGKSTASVFSGEHGVRASGAVEGPAGGDVENTAFDCYVNGLRWVAAIVLLQQLRCELH